MNEGKQDQINEKLLLTDSYQTPYGTDLENRGTVIGHPVGPSDAEIRGREFVP